MSSKVKKVANVEVKKVENVEVEPSANEEVQPKTKSKKLEYKVNDVAKQTLYLDIEGNMSKVPVTGTLLINKGEQFSKWQIEAIKG